MEPGSGVGPSTAAPNSAVHSHINHISAQRLTGLNGGKQQPIVESGTTSLSKTDNLAHSNLLGSGRHRPEQSAVQSGVAMFAPTRNTTNVEAGTFVRPESVSVRPESVSAQPDKLIERSTVESLSAAALKKALRAAEDETVISDDEEGALDKSETQRGYMGMHGNGLTPIDKPSALKSSLAEANRATLAESAAANVPSAVSREKGAQKNRRRMFGAQRPVLPNDPEDKMPLIPVLVGQQAAPFTQLKKEEDSNVKDSAPQADRTAAATAGLHTSGDGQEPGQDINTRTVQGSRQSTARTLTPAGRSGGRSNPEEAQPAGVNSSERTEDAVVALAVQQDAGAVDPERGQHEQGDVPESPAQYSRDPWAHDPWSVPPPSTLSCTADHDVYYRSSIVQDSHLGFWRFSLRMRGVLQGAGGPVGGPRRNGIYFASSAAADGRSL